MLNKKYEIEIQDDVIIFKFKRLRTLRNYFKRIFIFYETKYSFLDLSSISNENIKKLICGFRAHNFPDYVLRWFFKINDSILNSKEIEIKNELKEFLSKNDYFYVIVLPTVDVGKYDYNTIYNHELVHARYYLDDDYRQKVNNIIDKIKPKLKDSWFSNLEKNYEKSLLYDELNAYFSNEWIFEMKNTNIKVAKVLKRLFRENLKYKILDGYSIN